MKRLCPPIRLLQLSSASLIAALAACPAFADDNDDLAVLANDVNQEYCAEIYTQDVRLAAQGYQKVASAWEAVDVGYEESGSSVLLYWRGVLAYCLDQDAIAERDLRNLVAWTDGVDDDELAGLVADAEARLKRLEAAAEEPATFIDRRQTGGTVLLVGGAATAVAGFAVSLGAYRVGAGQTEQAPYTAARRANIAGLAVGLTGLGVGVAGLLVLVIPSREDRPVVFLPGPITHVAFRF